MLERPPPLQVSHHSRGGLRASEATASDWLGLIPLSSSPSSWPCSVSWKLPPLSTQLEMLAGSQWPHPGLVCALHIVSPGFLTVVAPGRVGGSSYSHVEDLFGAPVLPFLCLALFIEIVHRILLTTKTKVNRKTVTGCGGLAAAA